MVLAIVVGVNAGIISAWFKHSFFDYAAMFIALIGVSMPIFWLGLMGQWLFSIELGILPTTGREDVRNPVESITYIHTLDTLLQGRFDQFADSIKHLILPVQHSPQSLLRLLRELQGQVCWKCFIPILFEQQKQKEYVHFYHLSAWPEKCAHSDLDDYWSSDWPLAWWSDFNRNHFAWPGIGRYIYDAISYRDYPVIQTGILVVALIFVLINFIVDILYAVIDPRIKY